MSQHNKTKCFSLFILFILYSLSSFGQILTISDNGQTGTSGTNWVSSGDNPFYIWANTNNGNSHINTSIIEEKLNAGKDVVVGTFNSGSQITLNDPILKSSGTSATLTIKSGGRILLNESISATSNALNLVLWSDAGNDNNDGGVSMMKGISTNGGHLWAGGSSSENGSYTWNGLKVGDGPSVGNTGYNYHPLDLYGNISTSGGDILIWASEQRVTGSHSLGIGTDGASVNTGTGDVIFIADEIKGGRITLSTTGHLYLVPHNGAYQNSLEWTYNGTTHWDLNSHYDLLTVNNAANLSGLSIGRYSGMFNGTTPVNLSSSSNIRINATTAINGPISLHGGSIDIDQKLEALNSNITIEASGYNRDGSNGYLVAKHVELIDGNVTFNNSNNNIESITAQNLDGLLFTNSNGLTIGATSSIQGVSSAGRLEIATLSGDLLVNEPVVSTQATGDAVKLFADQDAATGEQGDGQIKISSNGRITVESGARALLYSGSRNLSSGLLTEVNGIVNSRGNIDNNTNLSLLDPVLPSTTKIALFRERFTVSSSTNQLNDIYSDFGGFWASGINNINATKPNSNHNLLGFKYGDITFSTGADNLKTRSQLDRALSFEKLDSYVDITAVRDALVSSQKFTFSMWINLPKDSETSDTMILAFNPSSTSNSNNIMLGFTEQNKIRWYDGKNNQYYSSSTRLNQGEWNYLSCTWNGSSFKIYVNGSQILSTNENLSIGSTDLVSIGQEFDGTAVTNEITTIIDDVSVWDHARSSAQISLDMTNNPSSGTTGLVAYYDFNQGVALEDNSSLNNTIEDKSGNNNHGSLVNFNKTGNGSNFVLGKNIVEGEFKALALSNIAQTGSDFSRMEGSSNVTPTENASKTSLAESLTSGAQGLNLGQGLANIPQLKQSLKVTVKSASVTDSTPDILLTQIDIPSSSMDELWFEDSSGNLIGNKLFINFNAISKQGNWLSKKYSVPENSQGIETTSPIRFQALKFSEFGLTTTNVAQIESLVYLPSGLSDPAFVAYNVSSLTPKVATLSLTSKSDGFRDGVSLTQSMTIQLQDSNGNNVSQQNTPIVISVLSGTATISGTLEIQTSTNGQAIFNDLIINGNSDVVLAFESPGLQTITSTLSFVKTQASLSLFPDFTVSSVQEPFKITPPLSNSTAAITYSSSNHTVANINSSTGSVTVMGLGTTVITASVAENDTYTSGSISATLTVIEAVAPTATFPNVTKTYGDTDFTLIPTSINGALVHSPKTNSGPVYWAASSVWDNDNFYENAPEPSPTDGYHLTPWIDSPQGWSASSNTDPSDYIRLDLGTKNWIIGVQVQGRKNMAQWVTSGKIETSVDGTNWTIQKSNATMNTDQNTKINIPFSNVVHARYIKITPIGYHAHKSMRLGILYQNKNNFEINFSDNRIASATGQEIAVLKAGQTEIQAVYSDSYGLTKTVTSTLLVNPFAVSVNANNVSKFSTQADPKLTFTFSPSTTPKASTITFTGTLSRTVGEDVGTYSITIGTLTNTNYNISFTPASFTISPSTATISNHKFLTLNYGAANMRYSYSSSSIGTPTFTCSNTSVATIDAATGAITTVGVGSTTLWVSLEADRTYTSITSSMTLVVNPLPVTITPASSQSKTFGNAEPVITYTSIPRLNSTLPNSSVVTFTGSLSRASGEDVGTYAIDIGTLTNTNFDVTFVPANFEITKLPVTITPTASQSKTYGEADPRLTYTASPAVGSPLSNGIVVALSGSLSRTAGERVNSYPFNLGNLTNANYSFTLSPETFEITKKELTANASSVSKEYDGTTSMSGVRLGLAGLEAGDMVTVNGTGAFDSPNVGTGLGYTISGLSLAGADADNYYLSAGASFSGTNGVISKAPLTITANNDNGVDTDPAYSGGNGVTYSGFKGLDGVSDLGGSLSYTGTSQGATAAGTYTIVPGGLTSSNYSITFVAGTLTIIVGDSDGDGVRDPSDNCPTTPNADQADADGDGVGDVCDNAPGISNPDQRDTDGDGIGDVADPEDDNDGCPDTSDAFPLDPSECSDNDGDGTGDNADTDDDNDGVLDTVDNCAFTPNPTQSDIDLDGIGDVCDTDIDGDGWTNEQEQACGSNPTNAIDTLSDFDRDGLPDCSDPDDDNDGYADTNDAFPLDPSEWLDTDADGTGNNADTDDDNDGFSDEEEIFCGTDPLDASSFSGDVDADGITDCRDTDNDNDGVNDTSDAFPLDPSEWTDTDADGVGNNADTDDDGDGYSDLDELECNSNPLDANELPADLDGDGIPDCKDTDLDGDGCLNTEDVFPRDPSECLDTDGDGLGDNVDVDDDGDGVIDLGDAFPLDPTEWADTDGDGIGDNADPDDNNDGFEDEKVLASGVLTPNSSGMESTWKIVNIEQYPNARVRVYDRNGIELLNQANYKNDWRGTYKNNPLPAGSYFYIVNPNNGEKELKGWLYISY